MRSTSRSRRTEPTRRGLDDARHDRLAGDGRDDRAEVLRLRQRRHLAGRGRSRRGPRPRGSERGARGHVAGRVTPRRDCACWVRDVLGMPVEVGGAFVTGATMANATALAAARDAVLTRAGWDAHRTAWSVHRPSPSGSGAKRTTVSKALGMVGLGRGRARILPSDEKGGVSRTACPHSTDRRSCAFRRATSTAARATLSSP